MGPIRIGANTFIGTGSTIMPGVTIGRDCVIGAMSLITRSVPENCVAVGVPARVISTGSSLLKGLLKRSSGTGGLDADAKRQRLLAMTPAVDQVGRRWLISRPDK